MSINNKYFNIKTGGVITEVDFSANTLVVNLGESIDFTNLSTGEPTTHWSWRFTNVPTGEIETSIIEDPTMVLSEAGKYNVELFAGSENSGGIRLKNEYVEILQGINLLDNLNNYTASYSLRKTRSLYQGNCLRVRRTSDDVELDIGFVNDELDTTTLLNFIGQSTGRVSIWYDQSGFGRDATQTNLTAQPTIVNNGNLIYEGTKIAMEFNNDYFDTPHLGISGGMLRSTLGVVKNNIIATTLGTGNYLALSNIPSPSSGGGWTQTLEFGGTYTRVAGNAGWAYPQTSTTHSLFELYFNGPNVGNSTLYQNNFQQSIIANTGAPIDTQVAGGYIGRYQQNVILFNGTMQEIIVFDDNVINDRSFINTNIMSYYDITV